MTSTPEVNGVVLSAIIPGCTVVQEICPFIIEPVLTYIGFRKNARASVLLSLIIATLVAESVTNLSIGTLPSGVRIVSSFAVITQLGYNALAAMKAISLLEDKERRIDAQGQATAVQADRIVEGQQVAQAADQILANDV